ncbi:MAG TPA: hypothetical protein VIV11_00090 [Kofleriaceae bacterium]
MSVDRRIALVSTDARARNILATYLREVGFDVEESSELGVPGSFGAVVLLGRDEGVVETFAARVRSWMKRTSTQRVVIVTSKPAALRELTATHAHRLFVLAAPAFGWDVVDALRAPDPESGPRGA